MDNKDNINFIFQLNNKNRSGNFFVLFIVSGIVFIGLAFLFIAKNRNVALITDILIAVLYFIVFGRIKLAYFEMLVTDSHMQINFYNVFTAVRNYQSIELPLDQLADFHVKKRYLGLRRELIVSVGSKYGLADYPPVSVSLLTKSELDQVQLVLREIIKNHSKSK